jgi:hypothetical protein
VRPAGALGSKNVGTSNHNRGENPRRRKIKGSFAMTISEGLVGPKGMANAGPNGQQVNIPALHGALMGGRRVVAAAAYWIAVEDIRTWRRKIRAARFHAESKCQPELGGDPGLLQ